MKKISANFNEQILGKNIVLKKYKLNDKNLINEFKQVVKDNYNYIFEFTNWDNKLLTEKDFENYFKFAEISWKNKERAVYAVIDRKTNKFIGDIKMYDINCNEKSAEIGIWFSKDVQGKGFATEAINLLTSNFEKKGISSIKAKVDVRNINSNNLMKRTGFKEFDAGMSLFTAVYYKTL